MKKIFIDGESGTTGLQIRQHLRAHPEVTLISIDEDARKNLDEKKRLIAEADLTIMCLPDLAAKELVSAVQSIDCRLIDASSAHRTAAQWVYGLAELSGTQRENIRQARRVTNPGCFATGAILLLRPLIRSGKVRADAPLAINAISGYSGGGAAMVREYESEAPPFAHHLYGLSFNHKHLPEMALYSGLESPTIFIPAVGNFHRGMLVSIPLFLAPGVTPEQLRECLAQCYSDEPFVRVASAQESSAASQTRLEAQVVAGSNTVDLYVFGNSSGNDQSRALLVARLDNLGKGASTAAVQNMNIMLGFPESLGLLESTGAV
ncbi:N-acetyl-gamma-glutamyl-phosphate reductase [Pseudomonas koreensis]|uniref:N-acetyl-gamma-glutamyl-phosphate reductase n=1 Tax=Pseudomonas koreensis TaxID=198620 RepID=A0AA94EIF2_9PSED|nr:N-acetyl-gamma-glutamyl-phosphate reductase [Pseudomonas koreensis]RVD74827.1 N-acetyl-gamma-glutamyl-phosphate reductase [Pseudomonas koreensis]